MIESINTFNDEILHSPMTVQENVPADKPSSHFSQALLEKTVSALHSSSFCKLRRIFFIDGSTKQATLIGKMSSEFCLQLAYIATSLMTFYVRLGCVRVSIVLYIKFKFIMIEIKWFDSNFGEVVRELDEIRSERSAN